MAVVRRHPPPARQSVDPGSPVADGIPALLQPRLEDSRLLEELRLGRRSNRRWPCLHATCSLPRLACPLVLRDPGNTRQTAQRPSQAQRTTTVTTITRA